MTEERALIARAVEGEPAALDRLASLHRPAVLRTARHILGDPEAAEDVAQEALLRLHASLPGFRGDAELSTWLYRVTLNLCRDQLRRRRHLSLDAPGPEARSARGARVSPDPDRRLDRERARAVVRAALERLPEEQREAVTLRYLHDLPYDEIARATGAPPGTVASRVFRALKRLGEELDPRTLELIR